MKLSAADIVRALLELSRTMPDGAGFLKQIRDGLEQHVSDEIVTVTLTTPTGSAGALGVQVQAALEQKLGKKVELIEQADASLIGGAIVQYGDQQIDLSLRGNLREVETRLKTRSAS